MLKRWNKSGQFYLVAAMIIASIIIGVTAISNYSKKQDFTKLESLKEEIQIESSAVLDYGNYNKLSETATRQLLENFSNDYITSEGNDKNFYFIFGKKTNMTFLARQDFSETIELEFDAGSISPQIVQGETYKYSFSVAGNQTSLIIDDSTQDFELNYGENFYFIVSQQIKGDKYIVTN